MSVDGTAHGDPVTVKIRASNWLLLFQLAPPVVFMLDCLLSFLAGSGELWHWLYCGLWGVIGVLAVVLHRWIGIDLTPAVAVVNNLRRRCIPWADITDVTQRRRLGSRRVLLWTADQHIWLPAISDFGAGRFDVEFRTIRQWWLEHRDDPAGPDLNEASRPSNL